MKKAPARFPTVKSIVVNGPVGFWPMRPRPRQSIPMETATVGMKAHLSNEKSDVIQRERERERGKGRRWECAQEVLRAQKLGDWGPRGHAPLLSDAVAGSG